MPPQGTITKGIEQLRVGLKETITRAFNNWESDSDRKRDWAHV
jgi:hypothetical protein